MEHLFTSGLHRCDELVLLQHRPKRQGELGRPFWFSRPSVLGGKNDRLMCILTVKHRNKKRLDISRESEQKRKKSLCNLYPLSEKDTPKKEKETKRREAKRSSTGQAGRLSASLTLVLTAVAYKYIVAQMAPWQKRERPVEIWRSREGVDDFCSSSSGV